MPTRRELANAVRALSMDAVQAANSGHPGAPMGMADIAEVLWNDFLRHNPRNPAWPDRDRFVLSNGHGSMLIYSLLHLSGYDLSIEELRNFRQLHAKTPGHPEYGDAPGIETTTGPLGQGVSNAVGMAIAEKTLAAQFNRPGHTVVDHNTYVFLGDGCLMEGISHEACSLAGTQKLGKLVAFYDDNGISIDGDVAGWFTDDTPARFAAYGWHVVPAVDGHDADAVREAIEQARAETERPTLICCRTVIGYGSPNKAGTSGVHGAALGEAEVQAARDELGWQYPAFEVPEAIYSGWSAAQSGAGYEAEWQQRFDAYRAEHPQLAAEFERRMAGDLPLEFASHAQNYIAQCQAKGESPATRKASQNCLDAYGPVLPELLGGSADLAGSNNTIWKDSVAITPQDPAGNYMYYGVREFGMSAMMNGMALHGGFIPYGATFLVFMEYARNAVRMASLMCQRVIFVYTHDSIGLGEDGPTHQPVEQLTNLRTTPNLATWRPCDTVESAVAWRAALEKNDGPTALVFTRQGLPHQPRTEQQVAQIERGAYILHETAAGAQPDVILLATGSEVSLAMQAAQELAANKLNVRVVSMPCTEIFDAQDAAYKEAVLPAAVTARVAVEAAHVDFWRKYVGLDGRVIGMSSFGESAPAAELFKHFGITTAAVVDAVKQVMQR